MTQWREDCEQMKFNGFIAQVGIRPRQKFLECTNLNTSAMAGQQSHSPICASLQPYLCLLTALSVPPYSPISAMLHT